MSEQITDLVRVGALVRRSLRAGLDAAGIHYIEHKGLFDSIFVVTATEPQWRRIAEWADEVGRGSS